MIAQALLDFLATHAEEAERALRQQRHLEHRDDLLAELWLVHHALSTAAHRTLDPHDSTDAGAKAFRDVLFHMPRRRVAPVRRVDRDDGDIDLLRKDVLPVERKPRGTGAGPRLRARDRFKSSHDAERPRCVLALGFARCRLSALPRRCHRRRPRSPTRRRKAAG
ncbi:MAG: hypothetical protein ACOY37_03885 [Pseudomonadota bacterium]